MNDDFRRFCRRALPNVFYSFFPILVFCFFCRRALPIVFYSFASQFGFLFFLAAVLFQTFSIWFFCQCGFLFFCPPCVFGSVFFTVRLAHSFVFTSFRKARLRQKDAAFSREVYKGLEYLIWSIYPIGASPQRRNGPSDGDMEQELSFFAEFKFFGWIFFTFVLILFSDFINDAQAFRSMPMSGSGGPPRGPGGGHGGDGLFPQGSSTLHSLQDT